MSCDLFFAERTLVGCGLRLRLGGPAARQQVLLGRAVRLRRRRWWQRRKWRQGRPKHPEPDGAGPRVRGAQPG